MTTDSAPPSSRDHQKYLGMDMHDAHSAALRVGEQLRVIAHGARTFRYALPPDPEHILVWIKEGKITRTA